MDQTELTAKLNTMDEQDVYASAEEPSGPHIKWKRVKNSENIYQTEDACCSVETDRTGPAALEESSTVTNCSYRTPTVILGVLCLLLLVRLITVSVLYNERSSKWEMKRIQFQTSYNNLNKEKDQLQTSYNNLREEKDQLQTSYNNLTKEKDQLQTNYNNLIKEIGQLQTSYNNLIKEIGQLQTSYNNLSRDKVLEERQRETLQQKILTQERELGQLKRKLDAFNYYIQREWIYFGRSFYYISSNMKTWKQSREDCQQKNTDLIIISSKEEQDFVQKFGKVMWIGLTDRETEGVWKWVDGTRLTTSFWGPNEPNSFFGINEDCAVTGYHSGEDSWNDDTCEKEKLWICEKRMSL
ncbi:C-type lectin domain family 4 member M-like [Betta splendens]|uniref:C-type lectin domain family 4 member M-like n=1 Tax=Betta splendens TaxID=158456 RepID=A0A6P7NJ32_BETSP|nr:C-type lectin domain family 4 member M-like [Betta splendens]